MDYEKDDEQKAPQAADIYAQPEGLYEDGSLGLGLRGRVRKGELERIVLSEDHDVRLLSLFVRSGERIRMGLPLAEFVMEGESHTLCASFHGFVERVVVEEGAQVARGRTVFFVHVEGEIPLQRQGLTQRFRSCDVEPKASSGTRRIEDSQRLKAPRTEIVDAGPTMPLVAPRGTMREMEGDSYGMSDHLVFFDPHGVSRVLQLGAELCVGREYPCDVVFEGDRAMSRRHLKIYRRDSGVWIEDLGSTSGTLLDGRLLSQPEPLTSGAVVLIGDTRLRYVRGALTRALMTPPNPGWLRSSETERVPDRESEKREGFFSRWFKKKG